jgi:hypothetical protein
MPLLKRCPGARTTILIRRIDRVSSYLGKLSRRLSGCLAQPVDCQNHERYGFAGPCTAVVVGMQHLRPTFPLRRRGTGSDLDDCKAKFTIAWARIRSRITEDDISEAHRFAEGQQGSARQI